MNQCPSNLFTHSSLFSLRKNSIELSYCAFLIISTNSIQEGFSPNGRCHQIIPFARESIGKMLLHLHIVVIAVFARRQTRPNPFTRNFNSLIILLMAVQAVRDLTPITKRNPKIFVCAHYLKYSTSGLRKPYSYTFGRSFARRASCAVLSAANSSTARPTSLSALLIW